MVSIYALLDPRSQEVRYVGKATHPRRRLSHHLSPRALNLRTLRSSWLKQLLALGLRPELEILEVVPAGEWVAAERRWIAHYRGLGARLTNMTDGGEGMENPPQETRDKLRAAALGHVPWNKGKKFPGLLGSPSQATRDKIRERRKGQKPSAACEAAKVAATKGKPSWNKGVAMRPESRDKIARNWVVTSPTGEVQEIRNLAEFCRQHGLDKVTMHHVATGRSSHHRGWKCRRL